MFEFQRQVKLKQAQNAFQDGRLDEAFAIAAAKEIRELRGGQVLLEGLVDPLLDRAAAHLAGGRLKEALIDVERALDAGGNRPRAAQLRKEVREALERKERDERREREVIESARAHLRNGSLRTGLEVLEGAPREAAAAERLRREAESRERRAEEARVRARSHLAEGDTMEALAAVEEAAAASPRHPDLPELRALVKKALVPRIESALDGGDLETAARLHSRLVRAAGESLETHRLSGALDLAREASAAFERGDFEGTRVALERLKGELPRASWVQQSREAAGKILEALPLLRAGPLGRGLAASSRERRAAARVPAESSHPSPVHETQAHSSKSTPGDRLLLWVDGVGTFLILTADRISLGRSGSSARPDIALAADISGYHAEVLRADDDYFVVAGQGPVEVNGRRANRRLLSSGDSVALGPSCTATFELPTALSPTAVLTLHRGQRIEGDVRKIILLKEHLLIGPSSGCHVQAPARRGPDGAPGPVVLSRRAAGLVCRAEEEILMDGRPAGREAAVPQGAHVQIGELTFTITGSVRDHLG